MTKVSSTSKKQLMCYCTLCEFAALFKNGLVLALWIFFIGGVTFASSCAEGSSEFRCMSEDINNR